MKISPDQGNTKCSETLVFFQGFSVLRIIGLLTEFLKANEIFFAYFGALTKKAKIILWLLRRLKPDACIQVLGQKEMRSHYDAMNKKGAALSDSLDSLISQFPGFQLTVKILKDPQTILFYKASLARKLPFFLACGTMVHKHMKEGKRVIFSPMDVLAFSKFAFIGRAEGAPLNKSLIRWLSDGISNAFERIKWVLIIQALPSLLFLSHLRNGFIKKNKSKCKVAMPVAWGIFKESKAKIVADVRRFHDDMYLYGKEFSAGDILHIFHEKHIKWTTGPDQESWKEAMIEKGIPYVEQRCFGINMDLFRLTVCTSWEILKNSLSFFRPGPLFSEMWEATAKGLYHYLKKSYEMANTEYEVELANDDYNPGHIIRTIVASQHGRRRVGVSHAALPHHSPQMCFVHYDKYTVSCDLYTKAFSPFWDSVRLEKIGRESIDSVVAEARRRTKNRDRIESIYGIRKWAVTILLPGISNVCLVEQWDQMYHALVEFQNYDLDCHVFLRFRKLNQARERDYMSRFIALPENDPRIILDHENFSTHELMSASDLLIAANASFGINEALVAGIPVFTFGYTMKEHLYFPDYGSEFILCEAEDVLRTLRGLEAGFKGFDCDWGRLRKDADYFHDGKNTERLRQAVFQTLQETPVEVGMEK